MQIAVAGFVTPAPGIMKAFKHLGYCLEILKTPKLVIFNIFAFFVHGCY